MINWFVLFLLVVPLVYAVLLLGLIFITARKTFVGTGELHVPFDPDDPAVTDSSLAFFDIVGEQLSRLEFEHIGGTIGRDPHLTARTLSSIWASQDRRVTALAQAVIAAATPTRTIADYSVNLASRHDDDTVVLTSNNSASLRSPKYIDSFYIPGMLDLARLQTIHQAILKKQSRIVVESDFREGLPALRERETERMYRAWIEMGILIPVDAERQRFSTLAMIRLTMQRLLGLRRVYLWFARRKARRILNSLGLDAKYKPESYDEQINARNYRRAVTTSVSPPAGEELAPLKLWGRSIPKPVYALLFLVAAAVVNAIATTPFIALRLSNGSGRDLIDSYVYIAASWSALALLMSLFVGLVLCRASRIHLSRHAPPPWGVCLTGLAMGNLAVVPCLALVYLLLGSLESFEMERWFVYVLLISLLLPELGAAALFLRFRKQLASRAASLCPHCGYNLVGTPGTRCPECGKEAIFRTIEAAKVNLETNAATQADNGKINE